MEALHSRLTTGEQSGDQEHCQPESPHRGPPKSPTKPSQQQQIDSPKPHGTKQSRRHNPERKRLRNQRQSIDSDTGLEHRHAATTATKTTTVSRSSPGVPSSTAGDPSKSKLETQEGTPKQKRERKPQRPGKYVCTYCGRACAKPSVLQKHIRSHTGERPYPCAPCGFSFKTKSNLYKHRKSHTHRVKAGLALGELRSAEEQVTESEDETRQQSLVSCHTEGTVASISNHETDRAKDCTAGNDGSYAVKKRLALRLSRGKQGTQESSDEKNSLALGSKGSTESGYFSRSESTEQSQDSPPNTSAKSYAEIILGKYGRLGHLQRMCRHNQQPSGQEDKNIPFTVPKKQVIDHITKLITINEAVVDTSKIDSVKPRRFSLSRKNSSESQKSASLKETPITCPKAGDTGYKTSGSITMGVPCEKFQNPSLHLDQPASQTSTTPLVRSHSTPSAASAFETSSHCPSKFRQSHSFDERKPSETHSSRRYGMLRRQPAIEIPPGAEFTKEEHEGSNSFFPDSVLSVTVPDHKQGQQQPYKCEACGTKCNDWESYKKHKQSLCLVHHPRNEVVNSQTECSQLINNAVRAGASAMRKRRKEESFEFDDPSSPSLPFPALLSEHCRDESNVAYAGVRRSMLQTCSVIQHTSSFEKQDSLYSEGAEAIRSSSPHEEYQLVPQKQSQHQPTKVATRKLVRQHSVHVPEILVTEDSNISTETSIESTSITKHVEKPDEFQWPQRSSSLAQLPIEKLPPKKKRLRLAEAAQSSGDSSFDSISLPRSPSQDSSASYASSRSTSFEESNRLDMEITTPLRRSRALHMLTVPRVHQHREMRRSASEQAPHDPQPSVLMAETRSKSFDYSCLSPERSAVGWRERRKCLLMRHTAVKDPDEEEEEEEQCTILNRNPEHVTTSTCSQASLTSVDCRRSPTSPLSGDTVLQNPIRLQSQGMFTQWELSQKIQITGNTEHSLAHGPPVHSVKSEASNIPTGQHHPQAPQPFPTHGPSGAARAHYLPMPTGLKLEIPLHHDNCSDFRLSHSHMQLSGPHITSSMELIRPVTSPSVAVRLQTETLMPACAIYTTLSQSIARRPQEACDAVLYNLAIPAAEYRNQSNMSPDFNLWSDDGLRLSGSGGNKRMLSPSNSIELPLESQQQQKRVKEEEERNVECVEAVDTCKQNLKLESQSCPPNVCTPITHVGPSFPSLLSSTCNSWCYLNYIKPNPSTLDELKPSVYSSWSTSGYDPNPPGLSSKTALALLHCKQRLSPSIYTTSPMSVKTTESVEQEDNKRPSSTEVYNSLSYFRDHDGIRKGQHSADDSKSNTKDQDGIKTEVTKVVSCSRSNEEHGTVHGGDAEKCQCEDCKSHFKDTNELHKCTHCSTESTNCKHCNVTFLAKGSLTEHWTAKSHGKETHCYQDDIGEEVCEDHKEHQYSDPGKSGDDADINTKDKDSSCDESHRSKVIENPHATYSDTEKPQPRGHLMKPESSRSFPPTCKDSSQKSSTSAKSALFSRRHLSASSVFARDHHSPTAQPLTPQREPSPPHNLSLRPQQSPAPPSSLSPSSCHVSVSPLGPDSPNRGLSSGPPGSLADTSDQCQSCLHPRVPLSKSRLSVNEVGLTHIPPNPTRPRGAHNLLSHLPLHSQQLGRAPSQLIPIGGIHMIQPRSPLPFYSLVSSPTATTAKPAGAGASWRLSDPLKTRFSLLQRQDTHKEMTASGRTSLPVPEALGVGSNQSDTLLHKKTQECINVRLLSSPGTETRLPEVSTDVRERCVYSECTQGQKRLLPPRHNSDRGESEGTVQTTKN